MWQYNENSTHLIRNIFVDFFTNRWDIECKYAALFGIPYKYYIVTNFKNIPGFSDVSRQTASDVLEQSLLVQLQQICTRWHIFSNVKQNARLNTNNTRYNNEVCLVGRPVGTIVGHFHSISIHIDLSKRDKWRDAWFEVTYLDMVHPRKCFRKFIVNISDWEIVSY